jgi:hypothetical protein
VGVLYRVRQFWRIAFLKTDHNEPEQARERLTPAQWELFSQLTPAEQAHALRILQKLLKQGENQPDLLVAALLHDVGKLFYRLNPFERAGVVLVQAILPGQARQWGNLPEAGWESLPGWRKAFITAEQHAEWGAKLAHQAGVSPLAERLIRQHHRSPLQDGLEMENRLLYALWVADNES